MRSIVRNALGRLGLLRVSRALFRFTVGLRKDFSWRLAHGRPVSPDGLPLPPPSLCFQSAVSYDPFHFLSSGEIGAEAVTGLLDAAGRPLEGFGSILDFGCGCGRVSRHLHPAEGVTLSGIDTNRRTSRWAGRNLPWMEVSNFRQGGSLPFRSGQFDLVLAIAVFPLLNDGHQRLYMEEIRRVLSPDGVLLLTLKGAGRRHELTPVEAADFDAGVVVIREPGYSGCPYCLAYHPDDYVWNVLASGFRVLLHRRDGSTDTSQDAWLLTPS